MSLPSLGTVLPSRQSLRLSDRHAAKMEARKEQVARGASSLKGCTRRVIGGEVRYYQGESRYAVVNAREQVRWFERRVDGYFYAIR